MREALTATEQAYRLDVLDPMSANLLALARMAAGDIADAIPMFEELVECMPTMSFPVASLLRAHAFQHDWAAVDRLLALAQQRQLREFQDGLPFIRAKRDPSPAHIGAWREELAAHVRRAGRVDVSRLVYAAHLGLVDEAYAAADAARLGPAGHADDIMGPDGYRTALLFQASMPELRNDPRFAPLSRGSDSSSSGWPAASGPTARAKCPTTSRRRASRPVTYRRRHLVFEAVPVGDLR